MLTDIGRETGYVGIQTHGGAWGDFRRKGGRGQGGVECGQMERGHFKGPPINRLMRERVVKLCFLIPSMQGQSLSGSVGTYSMF